MMLILGDFIYICSIALTEIGCDLAEEQGRFPNYCWHMQLMNTEPYCESVVILRVDKTPQKCNPGWQTQTAFVSGSFIYCTDLIDTDIETLLKTLLLPKKKIKCVSAKKNEKN